MEFTDRFIPMAGTVGELSMLTYFLMLVAVYALLGSFIFALSTHKSVAPEHRSSRTFTAIIGAIAGISYFLMQDYYQHSLQDLARITGEAARLDFIRHTYNAIGQYRYMDWAITTPLLLLKTVLMIRVKPHEEKGAITLLLAADLFMIVTGYIGEQQLNAAGEVIVSNKLLWGAISTAGYVIIPIILYRFWGKYRERAEPEERLAYKIMALTTVTFWGVYPIGYVLTTIPSINFNYIHIAFTIADIINKVGIGAVAYLAARKVLINRVSEEAVQPAYGIS